MNITRRARSFAAACLLVLLGACGGGGGGGDADEPPPPATTIGPAGGIVTGSGGAQVEVPAAALAQNTGIAVARTSAGAPPLPAGVRSFGPTFAFTPHGTAFAVPVTVTVPFDPLTVPAGVRPALYKTNAAQNGWEVVAGAAVNASSMTAQVTSFSFFNVGDSPPGSVEANAPQRAWKFFDIDRQGQFNGPLEPGSQTGGEVSKTHVFGPANPVFELDDGASPGQHIGEVFSSADGVTFWVSAENSGETHLTQRQSFVKRAPDATLRVVISKGFLRAIDGNTFPSLSECPLLQPGLTEAEIKRVCRPIEAEVSFQVTAFVGPSQLAFPDLIFDQRGVFFEVGGVATLSGFIGNWNFNAFKDPLSLAAAWTGANFFQDGMNGLRPSVTLNGPLVFDIDLSAVPVCPPELSAEACKDKEFTLHSFMSAAAQNRRGRESGVAAFLRDPLNTDGTALEITGLEATGNPLLLPPLGVEPPLACTAGANPAAGVLQFSAATYEVPEGLLSQPTVLVTRTGGSQGAVSVTFRASDGTAAIGVDYVSPAVTVRFADGDTEPRSVALKVLPDALAEPDKTVNLQLSEPGGCATLGAQSSAVATLLDDDQPPPPAPPSGLDTSFDTDGKASATAFGGDRSAMALQADGKIVMVGGTFTDFILARFNADGSLDTSFGIDGKVVTDMGSGLRQEEALAVAIQADGKIVVAGYTAIDAAPPAPQFPPTFALARYNTDGSLDTSFGTGGRVSGNVNGQANAVAIQPDGKIVLAGEFSFDSTSGSDFSDFTVARFNANGSLDTSFGITASGQVAIDINSGTNSARNIVLQPNGAIVVSGKPTGTFPGSDHTDVARFNANGSLDTSFGAGGKLTLAGALVGEGLVRQSDGRLVLVGSVVIGTGATATTDFALMRLNADGSPDTTFGNAGTVTTAISEERDGALAVALQADGRIVVAGHTSNINSNFAVARYNSNGTLDTGFVGGTGMLTIDFFGFTDIAESVAVQPDGKIVLGGLARDNVDGYGVARVVP